MRLCIWIVRPNLTHTNAIRCPGGKFSCVNVSDFQPEMRKMAAHKLLQRIKSCTYNNTSTNPHSACTMYIYISVCGGSKAATIMRIHSKHLHALRCIYQYFSHYHVSMFRSLPEQSCISQKIYTVFYLVRMFQRDYTNQSKILNW